MRKWAVVGTLVMLSALAIVNVVGAQEDTATDKQIITIGDTDFKPNSIVYSTQSFYPAQLEVNQGDTITIAHRDDTEDPHSLSIVSQQDMPDSIEEVFGCAACEQFFQAHFPEGPPAEGPVEEEPQGLVQVVNQGQEGLDTPGDSIWFGADESVQATVSASAGTTLYYLCIIHPWMQGSISVSD